MGINITSGHYRRGCSEILIRPLPSLGHNREKGGCCDSLDQLLDVRTHQGNNSEWSHKKEKKTTADVANLKISWLTFFPSASHETNLVHFETNCGPMGWPGIGKRSSFGSLFQIRYIGTSLGSHSFLLIKGMEWVPTWKSLPNSPMIRRKVDLLLHDIRFVRKHRVKSASQCRIGTCFRSGRLLLLFHFPLYIGTFLLILLLLASLALLE